MNKVEGQVGSIKRKNVLINSMATACGYLKKQKFWTKAFVNIVNF